MSVHVVFLLVRVVVIITHCAPHRVAQGLKGPRVCTHLIHARSERYSSTLGSPLSFNFPLERKLLGSRLAGLLRERQLEKALIELGWDKIPSWECTFVHRKQGLFLSGARQYVELREGHRCCPWCYRCQPNLVYMIAFICCGYDLED